MLIMSHCNLSPQRRNLLQLFDESQLRIIKMVVDPIFSLCELLNILVSVVRADEIGVLLPLTHIPSGVQDERLQLVPSSFPFLDLTCFHSHGCLHILQRSHQLRWNSRDTDASNGQIGDLLPLLLFGDLHPLVLRLLLFLRLLVGLLIGLGFTILGCFGSGFCLRLWLFFLCGGISLGVLRILGLAFRWFLFLLDFTLLGGCFFICFFFQQHGLRNGKGAVQGKRHLHMDQLRLILLWQLNAVRPQILLDTVWQRLRILVLHNDVEGLLSLELDYPGFPHDRPTWEAIHHLQLAFRSVSSRSLLFDTFS
mmetsp:Transcript_9216/g.22147  ORF Transcript_9216/g.22147 Transcript_9216/m.22147 type:complete len:309 (-) Transcript_9216:1316-2242(-)